MNIIKSIFRAFFLLYMILIFWAILVLFIPFYILASYIFKEKSVGPLIWCSHYVVARVTLWFCLIRLKIHGKERVKHGKSYLFVSNHQSPLDILANAVATPIEFKFLAKKEVRSFPIFGYVAGLLTIMVDRKDKKSKEAGMALMAKNLREGYSILIYPEGTRNRSNELLTRFYDGAFALAIQTGTPLVVQTIKGAGELFGPKLGFGLSPGVINCYIEHPIETKGMTMNDLPDLKEQVRRLMLGHLG